MKTVIFSVTVAALISGCTTSQYQFAPLKSGKTLVGQARFEGYGKTVIGELIISRANYAGQLGFTKGGGVALMTVLYDSSHRRFEGPLARGAGDFPREKTLPPHLDIWAELAEKGSGNGQVVRAGQTVTYQLTPVR